MLQVLAMKYHPDKNSGNKDAEKKFQQLKEAKEILCDQERRKLYDKWRNSGLQVSYKSWIGMSDHVVRNDTVLSTKFEKWPFDFWIKQQSMHWANPKPSRMLPEVGGSSNLQAQANPQHRRASEGGAALYFG